MRYIAPLTNFGGVRCWLLVGLASVNELSEVTVSLIVIGHLARSEHPRLPTYDWKLARRTSALLQSLLQSFKRLSLLYIIILRGAWEF